MKALILFLALLLPSFGAQAATTTTSDIGGVVVNAQKVAQPNTTVVLEELKTGRVIARKTNANGRYHFGNVRSDGLYRVTVISPISNEVYSFTGKVQLGQRHKRNFVIDYDHVNPSFMKSWQWNMGKATRYQSALPKAAL